MGRSPGSKISLPGDPRYPQTINGEDEEGIPRYRHFRLAGAHIWPIVTAIHNTYPLYYGYDISIKSKLKVWINSFMWNIWQGPSQELHSYTPFGILLTHLEGDWLVFP